MKLSDLEPDAVLCTWTLKVCENNLQYTQHGNKDKAANINNPLPG